MSEPKQHMKQNMSLARTRVLEIGVVYPLLPCATTRLVLLQIPLYFFSLVLQVLDAREGVRTSFMLL